MKTIDPKTIAQALVETVAAQPADAVQACDAACDLLHTHGVTDVHAFMRAVEESFQRRHNMRFASITIPSSISPSRQESLKKVIEKAWNKTVHLSTASDPSLLGGALLRVGDELFDTSIKSEIDRLVRALLAPLGSK